MLKSINETTDDHLLQAISLIIEVAATPLSEYELIVQLREQGWQLPTDASDTLGLFQSHFMVYHALYRLQNHYWELCQRWLEISALTIYLHPAEAASSADALSAYRDDKLLREYYSDIAHLEMETETSVKRLINQFWTGYRVDQDTSAALQVFDLVQPVSYTEIKQRYRQLAMTHHPDRGGNPELFQRVNWAFGVLQCRYKVIDH